jgi:hypothetical protein
MPPECLPWQAYFIFTLEDRTLDVQEEGWHVLFGIGMGHDSILELAEENQWFEVPTVVAMKMTMYGLFNDWQWSQLCNIMDD